MAIGGSPHKLLLSKYKSNKKEIKMVKYEGTKIVKRRETNMVKHKDINKKKKETKI